MLQIENEVTTHHENVQMSNTEDNEDLEYLVETKKG